VIDDPQTLRSRLRADLVAAMKARQPEVVSALRTTLAAIDNAEAVAVPETSVDVASGPIAGARTGVGSTEASRLDLSIDDLRAILEEQVADWLAAAGQYDTLGRQEAATRLRREADVLEKYLT
jgi:uncharacterized protein YqeY